MSGIISNTTPINYLVLIDHIVVLHHLYARIIIPQAGFGELQEEGTPAKVKAWVAAHPPWLEVRTVTAAPDAALAVLDVGEREAIRLAQELEADALKVIPIYGLRCLRGKETPALAVDPALACGP